MVRFHGDKRCVNDKHYYSSRKRIIYLRSPKFIKMKKVKFLSLVGIAIFLLISCSQEMTNEPDEALNLTIRSVQVSDYSLDNIPIVENNQEIEILLTNPEDKDDEKINNYLYELSLATRELTKDANFNNVIIEMARNSENQTANLLMLEEVSPEYYREINSKLSEKGLSIQSIAGNLTHKPVAPNPKYPETAKIEKYVPAIFVPNLEIADAAKLPIISPNIEVDCRKDESIEDNIVAWYYTEDGDLMEIMLSEETSLITTNPLFLLDNSVTTLEVEQKKGPLLLDGPTETSKKDIAKAKKSNSGTTLSFSSHELGITSSAYDYESWSGGKSEFAINAYRIEPNGTVHWIYDASGTKVIRKISSSEMGSIVYKWSHHASDWQPYSNPWTPNVTQNGVNMVFWNTFERDWNRSAKGLGTCTANGTTIYLAGKRKYDGEWYTWIPSTAQIHYTRFQWINSNWAHWNNSWKANFRLWKVFI